MEKELDAKEFTEPFCLERFKNGEPALFLNEIKGFSPLRLFSYKENERPVSTNGSYLGAEIYYKMRPTQPVEDRCLYC